MYLGVGQIGKFSYEKTKITVNCNELWSNLTFFHNLMNHGGIEDYCNGRMAYVGVCM